jgi:hypothetical protein
MFSSSIAFPWWSFSIPCHWPELQLKWAYLAAAEAPVSPRMSRCITKAEQDGASHEDLMKLWGLVRQTPIQQAVFRILLYAGQQGATVKDMAQLGQELDLPGSQDTEKARQSYSQAMKSRAMQRVAAQRSKWAGGEVWRAFLRYDFAMANYEL